jgi:alpha-tubulin suppressor-like RCC1 family protein
MPTTRLRIVTTYLALVGLIACGPAGPGGPGSETLAVLRINVADTLPAETSTTVTLTAIGNRGSDPLAGFSGTATLELDAGTVAPATVELTNGTGSVDATLGGFVGTVTLIARVGSVSASATIELQPIEVVPGDPAANAAGALPWLPFVGREEDYRDDAPDVPGLMLSFRAAGAVLHESATIGQLNDLLSRYGAGIAGFGPGLPGQFGPTLTLWLPTADPTAMAAAIAALREEPLLDHVHRRFLLEPYEELPETETEIAAAAVGPIGEDSLATWTWEREDQPQPEADANWGYERIRVPQMWNLNGGAEVASRAQRAEPWVAIIDNSALYDHPDLRLTAGPYSVATTRPHTADAAKDNNHATHVGGTIAATFNNREGIEGINPFANLMHQPATTTGGDYGLTTLMVLAERIRVVNVSFGIQWKRGTINPNTSPEMQQEVTAAGGELAHVLAVRRTSGNPVPIIVASAGNDSSHPNLGGARIEARWNSAIANAALVHGDPGILVVEAVGRDGNGTIARAAFSNAGGQLSAPGVKIVSTGAIRPYLPLDGTSMAAPHVTGVASYLLALRPEATNEQVIRAILETAEPVAGAAPLIDAFAAAMALDAILGGHPRALHALLDVDDGTLDGNLRVDPFTAGEVPHEQDAFGPRGDGVIDMRDFRRFRDALLFVENDVALELDGPFHLKRDLDLDGFVATPDEENVFPRFDFNGDGLISRTATAFVGGTLQEELTDLQVLQALWQDPVVDAAALPALLDSGDVHVDLDDAFLELGAAAAEVTFTHVESEVVVATVTLEGLRQHVTTLPVGAYDVDVTYFGAGGAPLATGADRLAVGLGGDVLARLDPQQLPRAVALHSGHGLLVRSGGGVVAWGDNRYGQIGDGTTTFRPIAVTVPGLAGVEDVQANEFMSVARLQDGRVASWGAGYLGSGSVSTEQTTPVFATGLTNALAIGVGYYHTLALRADGTVVGWGYNEHGQLGIGSSALPLVPAVMDGVTNAIGIAAGGRHTLVLLGDGTVLAVGDNSTGQLGNGSVTSPGDPPATIVAAVPGITGAVAVAASHARFSINGSSFALLNDGTLRAWGLNDRGQLGDGTNELRTSPVSVPGLAGVTAVAAGADHTLALLSDGTVRAWGANDFGQLGTGGPAGGSLVPVTVPGLSDIVAIRAGVHASMAIAADGSVYAWGRNDAGQLGLGDTNPRTAPTPVPGLD